MNDIQVFALNTGGAVAISAATGRGTDRNTWAEARRDALVMGAKPESIPEQPPVTRLTDDLPGYQPGLNSRNWQKTVRETWGRMAAEHRRQLGEPPATPQMGSEQRKAIGAVKELLCQLYNPGTLEEVHGVARSLGLPSGRYDLSPFQYQGHETAETIAARYQPQPHDSGYDACFLALLYELWRQRERHNFAHFCRWFEETHRRSVEAFKKAMAPILTDPARPNRCYACEHDGAYRVGARLACLEHVGDAVREHEQKRLL